MQACWGFAALEGRSRKGRAVEGMDGPGQDAIIKYKSKQVKGGSFRSGGRVEDKNGAGKQGKRRSAQEEASAA